MQISGIHCSNGNGWENIIFYFLHIYEHIYTSISYKYRELLKHEYHLVFWHIYIYAFYTISHHI